MRSSKRLTLPLGSSLPSALVLFLPLSLACAGAPERTPADLDPPIPDRDPGSSFAPIPERDASNLGLAGYAKVLCSAVFVSGREPDEVLNRALAEVVRAVDPGAPGAARPASRERHS